MSDHYVTTAPLDAAEERALLCRLQVDPTDHAAADRLAGAYRRVLRTAVLTADVADVLTDDQALAAAVGELGRIASTFDLSRPVAERLAADRLAEQLVAAVARAAAYLPTARMGLATEGGCGVTRSALSAVARLDGRERVAAAEALLDRVDLGDRVVLRLVYGLGDVETDQLRAWAGVPRRVPLSTKTAAHVLGLDVAEVRARHARGVEKVRAALDVG